VVHFLKLSRREQELGELFQSTLKAENIELYHLQITSSDNRSVLRVYIDKEGGVNVSDCSRISRMLSMMMDVEDPISGSYVLEVSSPGINRPLAKGKHFQDSIGQRIKVKTIRPILNKQKNFIGLLKEFDGDSGKLTIEEENGDVVLELEDIVKANIYFPFEVPSKKGKKARKVH